MRNQHGSTRDPHEPDDNARERKAANETLSERILPDEYIVVKEKEIHEENGVVETTLEIWMGESDDTPEPDVGEEVDDDADPPPLLVRNIGDSGRLSPLQTEGYNSLKFCLCTGK